MPLTERKLRPVSLCAASLFLIMELFFLLPRCLAEDQKNAQQPIAVYQKNRQAFIAEQERAAASYENQLATLAKDIDALKKANEDKDKQISLLEGEISRNVSSANNFSRIQEMASSVLFPLLSVFSFFSSFLSDGITSAILLCFLVITVINVFLYICFKHRTLFKRYKLQLIVAVVLLISCIVSPLLANAQSKREEVINKLEKTEKMLSKSDYERFIAILEEKPMQQIRVPSLETGDPLLKVYPEVVVETAEYWLTLAALYTHERQNGKALDAVKRIIQGGNRLLRTNEQHSIMVNCIKYLLQEQQTQEVSTAIEALSSMSLEVPKFLEIASLLKKSGMKASADKTLSYAIAKANSVADLVSLSKFFFDQQEIDKCNEALERALPKAQSIADVTLLAEAILSVGKDSLVEKVSAIAYAVTSDYVEKMKIVDLFLRHERKEEAVNLISKIIKSDTSRSEKNVKKLLYLINATLVRNLLPQTTEATETLIVMLGLNQAISTPIATEKKLKATEGLPDNNSIMLPQFYGLINEERGFYDIAEDAYIRSVLASITSILTSYGYSMPDSLNDFYLLGRVWVHGNHNDLIGRLDSVYTLIEKRFIAQQASRFDERKNRLDKEVEELRLKASKLQEKLAEKQSKVFKSQLKAILQILSTVATIIFIVASFIGCIWLAYGYCKALSFGKTYGFFVKLGESLGWFQVLSVLGCISGVATVITCQFFMLFQMIQENTHRSSLAHTHEEV